MAGERSLILKVFLGFAAGSISIAIIHTLNRSGVYIAWAPIIAAALIGAVAGTAEKSKTKIALGIVLACIGWVAGELLSRQLFHSIVTWPTVGGFIGLTAGVSEKSPKSMIGGFFLGMIGGLIGVVARLSTVVVNPLRDVDMQAMTILGGGIFISLLLGLKRPGSTDTAAAESDGDGKREIPDEK